MASSTYKATKYALIGFGVLLMLCGITLLAIGVWTTVDFQNFSYVFDTDHLLFSYASYMAIVSGAVLIIVGFVGFCGAKENNKSLLALFFGVLFLLKLLEVVIITLSFAFNSELEGIVDSLALKSIKEEYGDAGSPITSAWDTTQAALRCCGFHNGSDYAGSSYDVIINAFNQPWPPSCCTTNGGGVHVNLSSCLTDDPPIPSFSYATNGCLTQLVRTLKKYSTAIGITTALFMAIQALVIVVTLFQCARSSDQLV